MNVCTNKCIFTLATLAALASCHAVAEPLNYNIVSLNASASKTISRDTMTVVFAIQENGRDRNQVASAVTRKLNAVLAKAKANGDFETSLSSRNGYPYNSDNNPNRSDSWRESATVTVKSKNFKALDRLIADVQPYANVQSQEFSVGQATLRTFEQELTTNAIAQFRHKADTVTRAMGGTGYRIVTLNLGESGGVRPMMMRAYAAGAMKAAAPVPDDAAGNEDITLNINGSIQVNGL